MSIFGDGIQKNYKKTQKIIRNYTVRQEPTTIAFQNSV